MLLLIVSYTLINVASFVFLYAADVNLGDLRGGITLGGGWVFLMLGYNGCCIGLSTIRGGLVLFLNVGCGWGILVASFTLQYVLNYLLVSRLGGSASVRL